MQKKNNNNKEVSKYTIKNSVYQEFKLPVSRPKEAKNVRLTACSEIPNVSLYLKFAQHFH